MRPADTSGFGPVGTNGPKVVRDTTSETHEAEAAAARFDAGRQFSVPDIERWLKTAYMHGYRDALLKRPAVQHKPEHPGGQ